jgi:hypothetical protein
MPKSTRPGCNGKPIKPAAHACKPSAGSRSFVVAPGPGGIKLEVGQASVLTGA